MATAPDLSRLPTSADPTAPVRVVERTNAEVTVFLAI
jgi:hypothetical protein